MARRCRAAALGFALLFSGCDLEEVMLVDSQDVVVVEAHLQLGAGLLAEDRLSVFLHRTLGPMGESRPVPGARIAVVRRGDGLSVELAATALEGCLVTAPQGGTGSCYGTTPQVAALFEPGDTLELRIELPDGGVLRSLTRVPGDFQLVELVDGATCALPPATPFPIRWSQSEGAWAYVNETLIRDLPQALAGEGITVDPEDDPLYLLGLSISAEDTTIVFPGEFGLFNRFELDQELSVALQAGLLPPASGRVTIAAADRNYVNWVRGGSFNPSGQVRIPSVEGDGTGVFGSTVIRSLELFVPTGPPPYDRPLCPGLPAPASVPPSPG